MTLVKSYGSAVLVFARSLFGTTGEKSKGTGYSDLLPCLGSMLEIEEHGVYTAMHS